MTTTAPEAAPPVMTYQTLDEVSAEAVRVLVALWLLRPTMPEAQWLTLVVDVLSTILAQAEGIGRAYGAIALPVVGDFAFPEPPSKPYRPIPPDFEQRSDIAPKPDSTITEERVTEIREQVDKAVRTLAAEMERPSSTEEAVSVERVERMVKDETVQQMQRGVQDGIRLASPQTGIVGYRRGINPDACELCFWLWKDGYVYEIDQPMHRHTGCRCVPIPTTERVGRHPLPDDQVALAETLYERYTSETLRETSFRRDTEA